MSNLPAKRGPGGEIARTGPNGLHRDLEFKKVAGVCSGLAKWSRVPTIVWRLGFVLTTLMWGVGIPAYVILWLVMDKPPKVEKPEFKPDDMSPEAREVWNEVQDEMKELSEDLRND